MPCGSAMVQHARDGSSRSARRASTGERCAGRLRMGRCAPPQDSVLLSPEYDAGTPRGGSMPARCAGAAPCCVVGEKRKARDRAARCAMGGYTTLFRAVFWVLAHLCFPAYSLYIEPKSYPDRALSYTELGAAYPVSQGLPRYPVAPLRAPPAPATARQETHAWCGRPTASALALRGGSCARAFLLPGPGPGETPAPGRPSPGGERPSA